MSDAYQVWNKYFLNEMMKAKLKAKEDKIQIKLLCILHDLKC